MLQGAECCRFRAPPSPFERPRPQQGPAPIEPFPRMSLTAALRAVDPLSSIDGATITDIADPRGVECDEQPVGRNGLGAHLKRCILPTRTLEHDFEPQETP